MLYPLKFQPIIKHKVWGAESWLLSAFDSDDSLVINGWLEGNSLSDLLETYMDELVGGNIYQMFGNHFPLLFKAIDAKDDLSIQVHPDDMSAAELEQMGKTEMWYVSQAEENASVILGFNHRTTEEEVRAKLADDTILDLLQAVPVHKEDVVYIPAGTVHTLRRGIQVFEIQQASDLTYRLYDYHRPDQNGNLRPLHIDEALQVLDYEQERLPLVDYERHTNSAVNLVGDEHFFTNLLRFSQPIGRDYATLDSFVVYICIEGTVSVHCADTQGFEDEVLSAGELVLLPASLNDITLVPQGECRILETYVM